MLICQVSVARARHELTTSLLQSHNPTRCRLCYAALSVHKAIKKGGAKQIVPDGTSDISCDGIYIICKNKINLSIKDALL